MVVVKIAFELLGSLAIFMYGMQKASDGVQRAAGDRLQSAVNFMTRNTVAATLTGMVVTILVQSSSATSVMMVTFVDAGLLSLAQSVGVMLGSNIGTTLTGWLVAAAGIKKFSVVALAVPIFGVGFFMSLMRKKSKALASYGEALMGFSLLFLGLELMAEAIPDPSGDVLLRLQALEGSGAWAVLAGIGVGCVFTMLINASSATIAITIGMAAKGIIGYDLAAAIVLGANVGTTFDSFVASFGTNVAAKRSAWGNIIFNIAGALLVAVLFRPFGLLVDALVPGAYGPATAGAHIAMYHTVFNVATSLALLPFARPYARFLEWVIPEKAGAAEERFSIRYVAGPVMDTPELNLVYARKEICDMAKDARSMFARFRADVKAAPADVEAEVEWFRHREERADDMQEELSRFLLAVTSQNVSQKTEDNIHEMLRVIDGLEAITDSCMSLAHMIEKRADRKLALDGSEVDAVLPASAIAEEFLAFLSDRAGTPIGEADLALASDYEQRLDDFRRAMKKKAKKRLKAGAEVKSELFFIDMVRHIEKIGDYAFDVASALRAMR